jgi:hypothetical protein
MGRIVLFLNSRVKQYFPLGSFLSIRCMPFHANSGALLSRVADRVAAAVGWVTTPEEIMFATSVLFESVKNLLVHRS